MRRALLIPALCALGCSAIINPDPDRLGSDPDSSVMLMDGGADSGADAAIDAPMGCAAGCDDGIACTDDRCEMGTCVNEPNDGACPAGRCSPVLDCVAERCTIDMECNDAIFCNGVERCDPSAPGSGCVGGAPMVCDDGATCSTDSCNEADNRCEFTSDDTMCDDGERCTTDVCDPGASDEASGCIAVEDDSWCEMRAFCRTGRTCDATAGCSRGTNRDCGDGTPCTIDSCHEGMDRCINAPVDGDMDGFAAESVSGVFCAGGNDCDDDNPDVNPGRTELCNGIDDNCNRVIDEGCGAVPDDCASADPIMLGAGGSGSASGRFSDFADDYITNPICGATGGRDAVYYIDLPPGIHDVTIDTIGSAADTVLGVGLACSAAGLQAVCDDDFDRRMGTNSRIFLHRVGSAAGTTRVFILVEGFSGGTGGDYVVNVSRVSAAGDGCLSIGLTMAMDISGGGTVLGFSSGFIGGQRGSCQPIADTAPEAVFRVTGPGTGTVEFDVFSADFVPDIYLRSGMCGSGTEIGCDIGAMFGGVNRATLNLMVAPGTPHYFFVDGGRGAYAVYFDPN